MSLYLVAQIVWSSWLPKLFFSSINLKYACYSRCKGILVLIDENCNGTLDINIIIGAAQFVYIDTYIYIASAFRVKALIKKFCNNLSAKTTVW